MFTFYSNLSESSDIDLQLLENLRDSILKINRQDPIVVTNVKSSYNREIDLIMKKCSSIHLGDVSQTNHNFSTINKSSVHSDTDTDNKSSDHTDDDE